MKLAKLILLSAALLLAGCKSIGPGTIARDRLNYSSTLAESWKNQMLLNIVKTRYLDLPIYMDVGQIVSGYTLETSGTMGASLPERDFMGGDSVTFGAAARYIDRPTITYTPLTGNKFLEGLLTPIDPAKIFSLMQSGYAADFVLALSLDSLNGLRNHPVRVGAKHKADPEFFRALALLREIQDAGAVGMRVQKGSNGLPTSVFFFRNDRVEPAISAQMSEVRALLALPAEESSYLLVQSPLRGQNGELAVCTRSLSQMMGALSLGVEVPPEHVARKLIPPIAEGPAVEDYLLRIHSGNRKPQNVFVTVCYEGQWFWIANDDWKSKRTFSSILFLFTLANTSAAQSLPTLTIPTQ